MPLVNVALYTGRTAEQKAAITMAITKAISETAGVEDSATTVIFQDVARSDWAIDGKMVSDS